MQMAVSTRRWTIADWERLPRDGNRYEVVAGELFVTPMPTPGHQIVVQRLWEALIPYVRRWGLGSVFAAGVDVFVGADEVVEPDLAVFGVPEEALPKRWKDAPTPILVAEVRSESTWRRDVGPKRHLYTSGRINVYWIVDREERTVRVVQPDLADAVIADVLRWHPAGAGEPLEVELSGIFR